MSTMGRGPVDVRVQAGRLDAVRDAVPVIAALEGERSAQALLPADAAGRLNVAELVRGAGFRGAPNDVLLLPRGAGWVLIVGLGKANELSMERVRQMAGTAAKAARRHGFRRLAFPIIGHPSLDGTEGVAEALTEGALLGLYRYAEFRKPEPHERGRGPDTVVLVTTSDTAAAARRGAGTARVIADAVILARDLINGPSNHVTPTYLARRARQIARAHQVRCSVLPFAELKRQGFGGIAGVAQGSEHPAQFIVLDYRPAKAKATIALCGKGITFDTGGINLKSPAKMELMKYDMSGAAAVLATVQAAAKLKLPHRIVGIIAATENMPSGSAQKPGDVVRTLSGTTVEVLNTDAEGRLVLSDCLHYAARYHPDAIVDIATLTGACVVALGTHAIGLLSNNDRLAGQVQAAAERAHERVWRLPLWPEYGELMKSDIADLRNINATGEAGTICAAKFLEAFVGNAAWAHLDIASTAWAEKERPYVSKGAVGVGVRLLVELLRRWA